MKKTQCVDTVYFQRQTQFRNQ